MTNEQFKENLRQFKCYLKPALYTILYENADVFSDDTKHEIISKLMEADRQMQELNDYQEKRNNILRKGLEKIDDIYSKAKLRFQSPADSHKKTEISKK